MRKRKRRPMSSNGRGARCAYCNRVLEATGSAGKLAATRDHVVPKSKWVDKDLIYGAIKVWCCRQCNTLKADKMPNEWEMFMRHNPEWWRRPKFQVSTNYPAM